MTTGRNDDEVVAGWSRGVSGTVVHSDRIRHVEHVWGTAITINISVSKSGEGAALEAIDECVRFFAMVEETFSTYKPHTEVSLYRNSLRRPGQQSPAFNEVMAACVDLRTRSKGAFDPWSVPGGYEPAGYVKGWAAGRASEILRDGGFPNNLVNAGGDVCAHGNEVPGSGAGWPVGIVNPYSKKEIIEVVTLHGMSMATSGRYERGDHVIDPATGAPTTRVDSATVIGPDCGSADALASAAMVDGQASMVWFVELGSEWSLHLVVGGEVRTYGAAFG